MNMRFYLAPHVFKRALATRPALACLWHQRYVYPNLKFGKISLSKSKSRHIAHLFFASEPQRDLRRPSLEPGMQTMLDLDKRIHLVARKPPNDKLVKAFNDFILSKEHLLSKKGSRMPIEDLHATLLSQTLGTIQEVDKASRKTNIETALTTLDLDRALSVVAASTESFTRAHNQLARRIFTALQERRGKAEELDHQKDQIRISRFMEILSQTGDTLESRKLAIQHQIGISKHDQHSHLDPWASILDGFIKENNEKELFVTLDLMKELSIPLDVSGQTILARYAAKRNDVKRTKEWFTAAVLHGNNSEADGIASDSIYSELLEFCLRNQELNWGQDLLESLQSETPLLRSWNAVFKASVASGRGADDVDRIINIITRRSQETSGGPDISVFNGLIQHAISKGDPYMAERYFGLIEKWKSLPNPRTFCLQIKYRLAARDHDGALAAYQKLREFQIDDQEIWQVLNQLVQAFAVIPSIEPQKVMDLVSDLSKWKYLFPSDTVSALCIFHHAREEYFEMVDLLQTYAYHYSISQRRHLRDLLVADAINPESSTSRIWDTYMIFHQVFDLETDRTARSKVMSLMFSRGRVDLGTHVFIRMAKHVRADVRPDLDTYVAALEGIVVARDLEVRAFVHNFDDFDVESEPFAPSKEILNALEIIHNRFKLDTENEQNTRILNALMLAYVALYEPDRALELWNTISLSDEGPNMESLHIVFRACQDTPYGLKPARRVWEKLQVNDIEIDRALFAGYIGVLTKFHQLDQVKLLIRDMNAIVGEQPGTLVLGYFYNSGGNQIIQAELQDWIMENYPSIWRDLEDKGIKADELGFKTIQGINRPLTAFDKGVST